MSTFIDATGVWCLFVLAAFASRLYGKGSIEPRFGEWRAHLFHVAVTSMMVFLIGFLHIRTLQVATPTVLWAIGLYWLTLSLLFEAVFGRFLLGLSWPQILRDYQLQQGRLYPLVLVTVMFTPVVSTGHIFA